MSRQTKYEAPPVNRRRAAYPPSGLYEGKTRPEDGLGWYFDGQFYGVIDAGEVVYDEYGCGLGLSQAASSVAYLPRF